MPAPGEGTGVEGKPCRAQAMLSHATGPSGRSMKVLRASREDWLGLSSSAHLMMLGTCGRDHAQRLNSQQVTYAGIQSWAPPAARP